MFERLKNRMDAVLTRWGDKAEKATVVRELTTFVQESYKFNSGRPVSVRHAYWEALKDRRYFRIVIDRAGKGPMDPATDTREILNTPSVAEIRYYRLRGTPVPPINNYSTLLFDP